MKKSLILKKSSALLYSEDLKLIRKYEVYPREPVREIIHRIIEYREKINL